MKVDVTVLAMAMVLGLTSQACTSGSGTALPGSGGKSGSGGSGGSGPVASGGASGTPGGGTPNGTGGASTGSGGSSAGSVMPCGGDLVGTWTVKPSTLTANGTLDPTMVGAKCPNPTVTGSFQVTGMFTANANHTLTDKTVASGAAQFSLDKSCLVISSTPTTCEKIAGLFEAFGYSMVVCSTESAGNCSCSATIQKEGGLGYLQFEPAPDGNYSTSGTTLTMTGDAADATYAYCVAGTQLSLTPLSTDPPVAGTVVLEKAASSGTGGATGSGGVVGSGGVTGGAGSGVTGSGGVGGSATGVGGAHATGGTTGAGGSSSGNGPCDIYAASGNPCVAAHSTVRALVGSYSGKLYQVRNAAGMTKDIMTLSPGGVADGLSQDAFCSGTTCVITVLYDQSGKGNDLWYQGSTMVAASTSSSASSATKESLTVGGHKVYSLYINPGNSYWVDASKSGIALKAEPEGMYMVTSGKHYNNQCCFDYGNSETDRKADGSGAMDALNLSSIPTWGTGAGSGPWVMADLEYGIFAQNDTKQNAKDPSQTTPYVTAVLKNDGTKEFTLRGGDAASGPLGTYYKGALPGGWSPMKKQGAIVLGSGGDCCKPSGGANLSDGTFYEGCIVTGYPSDKTEEDVQANIVSAGYGK